MSGSDIFRPVVKHILSNFWGVLTRHEFDFRRRSGEWQRQSREVYDHGNGVTCLLYNTDTNCVLLTRQFRLPVHLSDGSNSLIEAPAGLLEGAAALERMQAELLEETGYEVTALEHLFNAFMSPGSLSESIAFFQGNYSSADRRTEGGGISEEGEDIEVMHVPLAQAMSMIDSGEICDAKTIILLQRLTIELMQKKN